MIRPHFFGLVGDQSGDDTKLAHAVLVAFRRNILFTPASRGKSVPRDDRCFLQVANLVVLNPAILVHVVSGRF